MIIEINHNRRSLLKRVFLSGKRTGKGKEYLNEKLIFEGEYFNGEKKWICKRI